MDSIFNFMFLPRWINVNILILPVFLDRPLRKEANIVLRGAEPGSESPGPHCHCTGVLHGTVLYTMPYLALQTQAQAPRLPPNIGNTSQKRKYPPAFRKIFALTVDCWLKLCFAFRSKVRYFSSIRNLYLSPCLLARIDLVTNHSYEWLLRNMFSCFTLDV